MKTSAFRCVSVAYAAENLKLGSDTLEVYPAEMLPFVDGELTSEFDTFEESMPDADGVVKESFVHMTNTVSAKWLPFGGNQNTPPNIRRGMRLELYAVADLNDQYYWRYSGIDNHLMRLETVLWAFSNTRDESTTELNANNSWFVEISTHNKTITVQTNKSDGEPFSHTLQLDASYGRLVYKDDIGQVVEVDSPEHRIYMENTDGSYIDMEKTHLRVHTDDTIEMSTTDMEITTENLVAHAKSAIFNFDQWVCNGSSLLVNHPSVFSTVVTVQGLFSAIGGTMMTGGGGSGAGVQIQSNVQVKGNTALLGLLTNNGVNVSSTHRHTGAQAGTPVSPPY